MRHVTRWHFLTPHTRIHWSPVFTLYYKYVGLILAPGLSCAGQPEHFETGDSKLALDGIVSCNGLVTFIIIIITVFELVQYKVCQFKVRVLLIIHPFRLFFGLHPQRVANTCSQCISNYLCLLTLSIIKTYFNT